MWVKAYWSPGCVVFLSGWTAYRTVQIAEHGAELWHYARGKRNGPRANFQAEAAGITPDVRMNPVLLKPTSDRKAQVVLMGKVATDMDAVSYHEYKPRLREQILSVYNSPAQEFDVLVLEGAGSPAEINLRDRDIVNMGMAEMAQCPVVLVADIDRGGVFASIYGTLALLHDHERARVKGDHQ